jgi:DNA-directed RNA polymerase subunit H (RpoH/RPB5)
MDNMDNMDNIENTCIEMFTQRGYSSIEKVEDRIEAIKTDNKKMCVFLLHTKKLNTDKIHEFITKMNNINIKHSIIFYTDIITPTAKKIIENLPSINIKVELFQECELMFNITKHRYQPQFKLLSKTETETFKNKFGTKFPIMLKSDPIAKFFGYKSGNIIEITTKNSYVTYSIVK